MVLAAFALSGFVSMAYEVLWLRYLAFYFHETIYLYSGIITVFVLGIGVGSLLCGYLASRVRALLAFFGALQAGIGITTVLAIYLPLHYFDAIYSGGVKSGGNILLILGALLLVPALLMGATFPVVTRLLVADLKTVGARMGHAYALNTVGCILGLLGSGFVLHHYLGMQATLYVLFGANMLLAAVLIVADNKFAWRMFALAPLTAFVIGVMLIQALDLRLPQAVLRTRVKEGEALLGLREGLTGMSWATQGKGSSEVHVWENGVRISRGGRSTFLAQGYIPLLIAPRVPADVLGLAFGAGLSYRAARLFPEVRRLDFVDISRDNVDIALEHMPENAGLKDDPRAHFIIDDAYSYLKYAPATYDLILMEPTPPRFSYQTASLYTREFYALARGRLNAGGFFAQVLPLKDLSPLETASVMRTFAAVFEHCLLWRNGWDCVMLGSRQEFRLDLKTIAERLSRREIQRTLRECAPLIDKFYYFDNFLSGLLLAGDDFRAAGSKGRIYTDDNAGLRFTTGRDISIDNVREIHAHLSSWENLRTLFVSLSDEFLPLRKGETQRGSLRLLTRKREYFMALLYKHEPRAFQEAFLKYINEYSTTKDEDLEVLRLYLEKRGLNADAEQIEQMIEAREEPQ